jgi:RNA-binding protein
MISLTPAQRRFLKAQAHGLNPVVMIGDAGLSEAVLKEADATLARHELIKIKVHSDNRDAREALLAELCSHLDAAPVQHIGKILVVYRPAKEPKLQLP